MLFAVLCLTCGGGYIICNRACKGAGTAYDWRESRLPGKRTGLWFRPGRPEGREKIVDLNILGGYAILRSAEWTPESAYLCQRDILLKKGPFLLFYPENCSLQRKMDKTGTEEHVQKGDVCRDAVSKK